MSNLNPDKALIFRITHRDNVPWILDHGLHCRSSAQCDPDYVSIGDPELIGRRGQRAVEIEPYGTLSDYVPFYFTPYSPMLYKIKTGHGGAEGSTGYAIQGRSLWTLLRSSATSAQWA